MKIQNFEKLKTRIENLDLKKANCYDPNESVKLKGHKCSRKYLHSVESVTLNATKFVSLMGSVERDLVQAGTVILTKPIINMSPHANG
jgi:hypothetical protein